MWDFLSEIEGPLGALLLIGGIIFLGIKTSKKYIFGCDRFKLDVPNRCVMIHKEPIFFEEIDFVTVYELEQPSGWERGFMYRAGSYASKNLYMTQIIFRLKDGREKECTFNKRSSLYKALKQLKPYVPVRAYIEDFKPPVYWEWIFIVVGILFFVFLKILSHN